MITNHKVLRWRTLNGIKRGMNDPEDKGLQSGANWGGGDWAL